MTQNRGVLRSRLFLPWLAFAGACAAWMWFSPSFEVVPFHLVWIGFALAYGFEAWALWPTVWASVGVSLATGGILLHRAATGVVHWQETTEILLMLLLAALVVWHVQRREAALDMARALADREAASAARRIRLARITSHEMRTPLTIAQSYVELMLERQPGPDLREELEVVHDELGRLARTSDRLLRMIQLSEPLERRPLDVDEMLRQTARRWAAVAERKWVVDSDVGTVTASDERLRGCLDTLIENAVRHTEPGDTVRLFGARNAGDLWLAVADSGPGFAPDLAAAVNARDPQAAQRTDGVSGLGDRSQTGLGIVLVQEVMEARGGRVLVGRSHEGGALVLLVLPIDTARLGSVGEIRQPAPTPRSLVGAPDMWAANSPDPIPVIRTATG